MKKNNWNKRQLSKNNVIPAPARWGSQEIPEPTRDEMQRINGTGKYGNSNTDKAHVVISKARNMGLSDYMKRFFDGAVSDSIAASQLAMYAQKEQEMKKKKQPEVSNEDLEAMSGLIDNISDSVTSTTTSSDNDTNEGGVVNHYYRALNLPHSVQHGGNTRDFWGQSSFEPQPRRYKAIDEVPAPPKEKSSKTTIKLKKLAFEARMPQRMNDTDAGWDCYAASVEELSDYRIKYGLGFAVEIPVGYCLLVFPRSSVYKTGMSLANAVGIIDAGYRGEVSCVFYAPPSNDRYGVGDRVCQLMLYKLPEMEFEEVQELDTTNDRKGGYGSTGK